MRGVTMMYVGGLTVSALLVVFIRSSVAHIGLGSSNVNTGHFNKDSSGSAFRFASYYSDHVVLQRGPERAQIWGYAALSDLGKNLTVTVMAADTSQRTFNAVVSRGVFVNEAVWLILLAPVTRTTPHIITVHLTGYKPITLVDVLFGDVWLCSGQSNMQFSVPQMFGHEGEEADAKNYGNIRLLNVERVTSKIPLYDLKKIISPWAPPGDIFKHQPQPQSPSDGWEAFSAVCYMYGKYLYQRLGYPIGLIDSTWGGTPVEAWSDTQALAQCGLDRNTDYIEQNKFEKYFRSHIKGKLPKHALYPPQNNSVLWNAMIHPLINMTIKGTVWYQGEQNTGYHRKYYACTFPAMITSWRQNFRLGTGGQVPADMPFGFVQIGPNDNGKVALQFGYPVIRWHQMADHPTGLSMKNTFMAVAMDLTDPISPYGAVHIRDKKTVAKRLSHAALNIAYNQGSALTNFPFPTHESRDKQDQLLVEFSYGQVHINIRSNDGFEICCAAQYADCPVNSTINWLPAPITHGNSTTVWLSTGQCHGGDISAYRYAWRETPCNYHQCAIYSDYSGDPLPTFTKILSKV